MLGPLSPLLSGIHPDIPADAIDICIIHVFRKIAGIPDFGIPAIALPDRAPSF
jgi:hypothetical protein